MQHVPVNAGGQAPAGRHAGNPVGDNGRNGGLKNSRLKLAAIVTGIILVLALVIGGWSVYQTSTSAQIDSSKYQAVFFTNGQVYFGKLQKLNGGYFRLNDIFYLEAQSSAQEEDGGSENPQETSADQAADVQLIKLGNEVHGPEDEMIISKEQILFFENLKKEGKVSGSIDEYKKTQQR